MRGFLARKSRPRQTAGTGETLTQQPVSQTLSPRYRSSVSDASRAAPGTGYLDVATAAPLHPVARVALDAALADGWADPDRVYREGRRARLLLDGARDAVARVVGARPEEVSFCPSGTVAAHLAVLGTAYARRRTGRHLVVSAVEHSTLLAAARHEADAGAEISTVGVDRTGRIAAADMTTALRDDTALAALQSANHEVGTLQPVTEVAEACASRDVPFVVDAAQTVGRLPVPTGWSVLVASARKWGGPTGVGVLAVRRGTRWRSPWPEDEHEGGHGAGPVPLPLVLAAAASLEAREAEREAEGVRLGRLVERLRAGLAARIADVEVLGPDDPHARLPHLVAFSCLYVAGEALQTELDRAGFSVSSGSSCSSSALTPSHVLEAMGVLTHGNVRVSLPSQATEADIDRLLDVLPPIVDRLRRSAGAQDL
jgi:cysteine desulfurase